MTRFEDVHKQLSAETVSKIRQFIDWVDGVNPDNAIALDEIFYELEEEVYSLTVKSVSEEYGGVM